MGIASTRTKKLMGKEFLKDCLNCSDSGLSKTPSSGIILVYFNSVCRLIDATADVLL